MGGGPRQAVASMEESFGDIIKFVESNYRSRKERMHAVAGLSMEMLCIQLALSSIRLTFDYVGIFSSSIPAFVSTDRNPDASQMADEFVNKLKVQQKNGFKLYWIACGKTIFYIKFWKHE